MTMRALHRYARAHGIEPIYEAEGETVTAPDETLSAILGAMGLMPGADAPQPPGAASLSQLTAEATSQCFVPDWLEQGRSWGITCQLYALRSSRNAGIGDFEDLARLAEWAAREGADFIGVNPLHALFWSDPGRCSPYAPSDRRLINPMCLALDAIDAELDCRTQLDESSLRKLRDAELVDYAGVAELKERALRQQFRTFREHANASDFERYRREHRQVLERYAAFEVLSAHHGGRGWLDWPDGYGSPQGDLVQAFLAEHEEEVAFFCWLQWQCDRQLRMVQRRARAAGMRIGLYVDLAVGVAPDGAATWSDPDLVVPSLSIGAPPDLFNHEGQNWGLAPVSPAALRERGQGPFRELLSANMAYAGAIRIDHVMGLYRQFWIPRGAPSAKLGAYVLYPFQEIAQTLCEISRQCRTLVVGEDLGTVPQGFRPLMNRLEIQRYSVFYFERQEDGSFQPPKALPRQALACLATHDLPPLAGWWRGTDIDHRLDCGLFTRPIAEQARAERREDRTLILQALAAQDLVPANLKEAAPADLGDDMPASLQPALNRFLARAPSRLIAIQLEDLLGCEHQFNLPGTIDEHPNWRRRLPVLLEDVGNRDGLGHALDAVRAERGGRI